MGKGSKILSTLAKKEGEVKRHRLGQAWFSVCWVRDPSMFLGSRERGRRRRKVQELERTLMRQRPRVAGGMESKSQVKSKPWKRGRSLSL